MDLYDSQASVLKVIAHPVRLHMLDILRRDGECVCHLSAALHRSQPYVSQQLAVLRNAGLIRDEKQGNNVFYHLAGEQVATLVAALLGPDCADAGEAAAPRQSVAGCICPKCRSTDLSVSCSIEPAFPTSGEGSGQDERVTLPGLQTEGEVRG